jgi:hypothetical protein
MYSALRGEFACCALHVLRLQAGDSTSWSSCVIESQLSTFVSVKRRTVGNRSEVMLNQYDKNLLFAHLM